MKISKDLNLVIDRPQEDGSVLHVHSSPITLSMFEDHSVLLSSAMMRVYGSDLPFQAAAKAAPKMIASAVRQRAREEARKNGVDDNMPSAYDHLLMEMHRRTMVLVPQVVGRETIEKDGKKEDVPVVKGYEPMLIDEAVRRELLDDVDVAEVDGLLLFFSVAWRFHGKADRMGVVAISVSLWNAYLTSSNSTEYGASLPTSIAGATSGATAPLSSVGQTVVETGPNGEKRTSSLPC